MIFQIHYFLESAGICAIVVLLGVFVGEYTDASELEIGSLFLIMPVCAMISRPILCAIADRSGQHKRFIIIYESLIVIGFLPFVIIPFLGPAAYLEHPRICWYILLVFKTIGSIGIGSVSPIVDSLAINYTERINADYSSYRTWGTVSWGLFGLIIGQLNEVWFLPRFVPAFLILLAAALLEMLLFWLWPDEFFVIVPKKDLQKRELRPKQLMSKKQIWQEVKMNLIKTIFCRKLPTTSQSPMNQEQTQTQKHSCQKNEELKFDKKTQLAIFVRLIRRDPRILAYLLVVTLGGIANSQLAFFFIFVSRHCNVENDCNFSHLAGYLQSLPAFLELAFFIFLTPLKKALGRVNLYALTFAYHAARFLFYINAFNSMSPYISILSESMQGCAWAVYVVFLTELAHEFANESDTLLPELIENGVVDKKTEPAKLVLVLKSTMQALFSGAMDGAGAALGALLGGLISDKLSFEALWFSIGLAFAITSVGLFLINQLSSNCGSKQKNENETILTTDLQHKKNHEYV